MARILISLLLTGLVLPSLLAGCDRSVIAEREHKVINEAAIPLIDINVAAKTETATFALG